MIYVLLAKLSDYARNSSVSLMRHRAGEDTAKPTFNVKFSFLYFNNNFSSYSNDTVECVTFIAKREID